jgi:hypothetical protein
VSASAYFVFPAHPSPLKCVGVGVHIRHISTPQLSQVTSLGLSKPSATSLIASHLSHLNSYIGINKPFEGGIAIPIAFFDALLPIGYFADSALSGFHLIVTALVTTGYLVFFIGYPFSRIDKPLLEAILAFHKPDHFAYLNL